MKERIKAFQYIRVMAFLLIFISHCSFATDKTGYFGAFGVSIFIVMSGFLEYYNMEQGGINVKPSQKVTRRVRSVFPLHVLTFLASLPVSGIAALLSGGVTGIAKFVCKSGMNLSMLHSFIPVRGIYFSFNAVSWYLTLVLFFAAVAGPARRLCKKFVRKFGGGYCICMIFAIQVLYSLVFATCGICHWLVYINPVFRLTDFMAGMVLADAYLGRVDGKRDFGGKCDLWLLIFPVMLCAGSLFIRQDGGVLVALYLTAVWLPASLVVLRAGLYFNRGCVGTGNILYRLGGMGLELFMFHQLIIRYTDAFFRKIVFRFAGESLQGKNVAMVILEMAACLVITVLASCVYHGVRLGGKDGSGEGKK